MLSVANNSEKQEKNDRKYFEKSVRAQIKPTLRASPATKGYSA